ncbi:MAG: hypothetical protein AAF215_17340 [Cyanobacteria bacterium P01_A01_bin.123]
MARLQKVLTSTGQTIQQAIDSIIGAAGRIFSPSDDEYPETGVQPFEGDIPETHHHD